MLPLQIFLLSVLVFTLSTCNTAITISRTPPDDTQDMSIPIDLPVEAQAQQAAAAPIEQPSFDEQNASPPADAQPQPVSPENIPPTDQQPPAPAQDSFAQINPPADAPSQPSLSQPEQQTVTAAGPSIAAVGATNDCPSAHFLDVSTYTQGAIQPQLNVTCTADTVIVESNGIPNFEFVQITPTALQAQSHRWQFPLQPTLADAPTDIPLLGPIAVAVNGLPIYGPNEGGNLGYGDPYLDQILDYCNGHTGPRGEYHFHARPDCLFEDMEGNVSLVIAYAFDGYPILAPYICVDTVCSQTKEVQSSWQRTSNAKEDWSAHEYVAGSGDLDQCNGLTGPDGSYRYYATDTFPYFLGCYRGQATVMPGPGGNGAPPDGAPSGTPPMNGSGQQPPPGQQGQGPDLTAVAAKLGVSEADLRAALGPPPPDLAAAAAQLGISEADLRAGLGPPPGQRGN